MVYLEFKTLSDEEKLDFFHKYASDIRARAGFAENYSAKRAYVRLCKRLGVKEKPSVLHTICSNPTFIDEQNASEDRRVGQGLDSLVYAPAVTGSGSEKLARRWFITSALNNVQVHAGALRAFRAFCQERGAQMRVVPLHYKNVSLMSGPLGGAEEYWWPSELNGQYLETDWKINENLMVLGRLKVQATAKRPLQGLGGYHGAASCIVGHPRVAQEVLPDHLSGHPILLMSTGCVSERVYSESRAGYLTEYHHKYAGIYVEMIDDKRFCHRLVSYNETTDSLCDMGQEWRGESGEWRGAEVESLSIADYHMPYCGEREHAAVLGLIRELRPRHVFLHDLFDCFSVSHWHEADPFMKQRKRETGQDSLEMELAKTELLLEELLIAGEDAGVEFWVVPSNHSDHIYKWLKSGRGLSDPVNFSMFFKLGSILCTQSQLSRSGQVVSDEQVLYWALSEHLRKRLHWPGRGDSKRLHGVEHLLHGDVGPNGVRGSAKAFLRYRHPVTLGHYHTPQIIDDVFCNGVNAPGLNYIRGASSNLCAHTILYKNGERTLFHVV